MATEQQQPLRLRFAPSPTGSLHVGGARTALFNYLMAKHTHGSFVLRIEDTDASRNRPESEAAVLEDLQWLGLQWDEGPDVGGDFGPYRQSERFDLYAQAAQRLLDGGAVYECFCTPDELAQEQAEQRAAHIIATRYSGRCSRRTPNEIAALKAEGRSFALRFRIPPGQTTIEDRVHGAVTFDHLLLGDFVVVRTNGIPTYNFAAAFDDARMQIDLVIRGDEHLANTPLQIMVLQALGERLPAYAHVPLILNEDHQKLSKRHQTVGVAEYRNAGYLPDALIDHLVLLGWSPGDESEHFPLDDLTRRFSLDRIGRAPAVYNAARLRAFNARAIRALAPSELSALVVERLRHAGYGAQAADPHWLKHFLDAYAQDFETLADITVRAQALLEPLPSFSAEAQAELEHPQVAQYLAALRTAVQTQDALTATPANKIVPALAKEYGLPVKQAYEALRVALTGQRHGAPLAAVLGLLGPERIRERLGIR